MKNASVSETSLGFQIHTMVFVPTMVLLFAIDLWTGSPYWAVWLLPGWGVGLLAHWWFGVGPGANRGESA